MDKNQFELTKDEALDLYFKIVLTRKTENKHEELYDKQVVPVYTHLGTGQEAVGCGVSALLRREDYLIGTHRGVAEYVGKGMSVKDIFLEYGGRANSISGGRAGLHLHNPELHILPLLGGLGTDFSLAVGAGISIRNKNLDQVVVDYFGEGAAEQADFHPAMNMAMLFKVPVIFCCCTNQFVEYHHYRDTNCTADIAPRAEGYGMAWKIVEDGNDIFSVGRAMKEAASHTRASNGPYFLEFKTYRIAPHHKADQCLYRDANEVEEAARNDPILKAQKSLIKRKWANKKDFERIADECGQIIDQAVQALVESELPDAATVMNYAMSK
ncbi:MAG: thiamine pyrophosphate-dependent dehydrogenase E1 component subunit alpha [Deltaproteobacteria bacterium]|nr:MAG: thiamine pyrophosphate-dependent dehydrogenase E1 component subunit alpha [Deltaproteobacteria bacterium]